MKKVLIMCVLAVCCFALCSSAGNSKLDAGKIKNSVYNNKFFGMSVHVPEKWNVQSSETNKELMDEGTSVESGKDKNMKAVLDSSVQRSVNLLTVFKYPIGSAHDFNSSFAVIAEKLPDMYSIRDGRDYLTSMKTMMENGQLKYDFYGGIKPVKIGNKNFYMQKTGLKFKTMVIHQNYYSYIVKGYALCIVASWASDSEWEELNKVLNAITFNK